MTDNSCGHETTDGGECHNPAGDNGKCWIPSHNDPDAENPHGRDFTISEADHEDILEAARMGMSKSGCARAAGTGPDQLERYVSAHDNFREAFMRARHKGERKLVRGALHRRKNDPEPHEEMDGQHARFLLSTSFDYIKTEKREVSGEGGGAINVVINEETVHGDDGD